MAWRLALPLLQSVHVMLELILVLLQFGDLTAQVGLTGRVRPLFLTHDTRLPKWRRFRLDRNRGRKETRIGLGF